MVFFSFKGTCQHDCCYTDTIARESCQLMSAAKSCCHKKVEFFYYFLIIGKQYITTKNVFEYTG